MTSTSAMEDVFALCEFAQAPDLIRVLDRAGDVFRPLITRQQTLPPYLVEAAFAAGDQWLVTLAANDLAINADPILRRRVAATGRGVLAPVVLKESRWTLPDRRALLAAADPTGDPGWIGGPGGDAVKKLRRTTDGGVLRSLVVSPFPQLVLRALETAPELTRAEQFRALLSLHRHGGPTVLAKALKKPAVRNQLRAGVSELAIAATTEPDGLARLRAAVAEAESTPGAIEELYRDPRRAREILSLRVKLDWAALKLAHEADPFWVEAADAMADRPDCPEGMLRALCQCGDAAAGTQSGPAVGPVNQPHPDTDQSGPARFAEEFLFRTRPAVAALDLLQDIAGPSEAPDDGAARAGWVAVRERLAELVSTTLDADPQAWRTLRERLPRAKGTVAEVLAEAAARAAASEAIHAPWPGAAEGPPAGVTPKRERNRMAFFAVLNAASTEAQRALWPQLDERTAYDLLVLGDWRDEWAAFTEPGGPERERRLLARRPNLSAENVQALAELDDPAVNAGLIYQRLATWEQRRALVAGVPLGAATGRLPVDTAFRESLLGVKAGAAFATGSIKTGKKKEHLAPMVGCGDPDLIEHIFSNVPLNSRNLQLRLLLGIWEHSGREKVGELMPYWFQDKVRAFIGELLTADDPDKALERLREAVHEEAAPTHLVRRLRTSGRNLAWLLAEGYQWDWQVMVDEHRRKAFHEADLKDLCALPDCPEGLRREAAASGQTERGLCQPCRQPGRRSGSEQYGVETALESPLRAATARAGEGPESRGLVPRGRPAREALRSRQHDTNFRNQTQALIGQHLDGNPDAWVLTIRLLPEFPGSLPELLATASVAVG